MTNDFLARARKYTEPNKAILIDSHVTRDMADIINGLVAELDRMIEAPASTENVDLDALKREIRYSTKFPKDVLEYDINKILNIVIDHLANTGRLK